MCVFYLPKQPTVCPDSQEVSRRYVMANQPVLQSHKHKNVVGVLCMACFYLLLKFWLRLLCQSEIAPFERRSLINCDALQMDTGEVGSCGDLLLWYYELKYPITIVEHLTQTRECTKSSYTFSSLTKYNCLLSNFSTCTYIRFQQDKVLLKLYFIA